MMVIWDKVGADLWGHKVRTILAVLSIAAGVFAIGATFGMVDQLMSGMDEAHQASIPSHINMYLTHHISRDMATSLENIEGVEGVEPYNAISVFYKLVPEDEWKWGMLFMRDDYERQKYDVTQLVEGHWPGKGDIGIERLSSQFLDIGIGDEVIFKLGRTQRSLSVGGVVRYPFVGSPEFGAPAYFFISGPGMERFDISGGTFGALLIRVKPYSTDYVREVGSRVKERLAKGGVSVSATFYQDPKKHWGRPFVEGIMVVLQVLAVVSLFTSVILVSNTLMALITQQTHQIGIIKAIGGGVGDIVETYLVGVLVYGLLALGVSLPLGAFAAFSMTQWFLVHVFDIDYDLFRVSSQAIVLQSLSAIAVPLLAGLVPVLQGAAITVREAIAAYGLGSDFGSSPLDRAVERMGQRLLPSRYAIALGNMFRRKRRLFLTQLALVTAGAMFLVVMSLSSSINFTLDQDFARRGYDIVIQFDDAHRIDRTVDMALSVDGVEKAQVWCSQPASLLRQGQRAREAGTGTQLVGLPVGREVYKPLIVAGRWLQPGDDRVVVMNQKTADTNHIQVNNMVTLDLGEFGQSDWQVVGFYQVIFASGLGFDADTLYAPQEAVFGETKQYNRGGYLYVRARSRNADYVSAVTAQLKNLYEDRRMRIHESATLSEIREQGEGQFGLVTGMLMGLAMIMAVVGGIALMGALSISVVERTKEIGVLRAIGAQSGAIMGMLMMEGILQGLLSWALAVPISLIASRLLARTVGQVMFQFDLNYRYNYEAVGIWLAITLVISALASILPARHATVISVRESLAYE